MNITKGEEEGTVLFDVKVCSPYLSQEKGKLGFHVHEFGDWMGGGGYDLIQEVIL